MKKYLVCITGASGAIYGIRTMQVLADAGHAVYGVVSAWGETVIYEETGKPFSTWADELGLAQERLFAPADLSATPASGSFRLDATIVAPCSMNSAGAIAGGICLNLIHRAALIALKEGRPLVLVPRETPLSLIDLHNLSTLASAGAAIVPASPAFYHHPQTIDEMVDFVVGKVLDYLAIDHALYRRWKS